MRQSPSLTVFSGHRRRISRATAGIFSCSGRTGCSGISWRDILSATPRQIYLQHLLGYPQPAYAHIPLLMDAQGRRLAKRDRDLDLSALSKRFSPEEILGFLAWSAGIQPEMRPTTLDALIPLFSWDKIPRTDLRLPAEIFPEGAST